MTAGGIAIGLDIGTSGVRAALVDASGTVAAFGAAPLTEGRRRDPDGWWDVVGGALRSLAGQADLSGVRALAVDGTSGTVLPAGHAGRPLAPASLYNDRADPTLAARVAEAAPAGSAARGAASPLAKALAWRNLPGLARVLHQADWVAGRLRGSYGASDWNNALKTGFDPVALAWPDWVDGLGLDRALLPDAAEPGSLLGPVDPGVARELGLPRGVMVAAGTTDGCAAFLATGAFRPGEGVTSLGTTLTLKLLAERPVFAPESGIYSHRLCGLWLPGGASNSGGAALARHFDADRIAALSAELDPAQASPLDYYPLPAPGERFPYADPAMAPRETPRPADDAAFLHGLLEGIARIEALGYRRLAELGAPPVGRVFTVGGGGARNPAWSAIRARVLGVPLMQPRSGEAAAGTAVLALRALGLRADPPQAPPTDAAPAGTATA